MSSSKSSTSPAPNANIPGVLVVVTRPPSIQLPEQESAVFAFVLETLRELTDYFNEVVDTVTLFNAILGQPHQSIRHGWLFIPCKQAVVALYNYRMAMEAVVTAVTRRSATLKKIANTSQMEAAKQAFRGLHPHTRELRQAILHQAELAGSEQRKKETRIRADHQEGEFGFSAGGAPQANLLGDRLQLTFAGKVYFQTMNLEMTRALADNAVSFVDAFRDLGFGTTVLPPQ